MTKNNKGEQTKIKLIECAAELFYKNGYNATGINDILKITQLPKGSFYFQFESKKELAIQVNFYYEKKLATWILETSKGKTWDEFITDLVNDMIKKAEEEKYFGCPLTTLGHELAFFEPEISKYYSDSLTKLISLFASILKRSGIPEEKTNILAKRIFAMYEGYLVYYRISKDISVLKDMSFNLIAIYKNYLEIDCKSSES